MELDKFYYFLGTQSGLFLDIEGELKSQAKILSAQSRRGLKLNTSAAKFL